MRYDPTAIIMMAQIPALIKDLILFHPFDFLLPKACVALWPRLFRLW